MDSFDITGNQNLYFHASQEAAKVQQQSASKTQKKNETKRSSFQSSLSKSKEELELTEAGLPSEIAGLEPEKAVEYLMDQAFIAGDKLKASQMPENFADYRKKVSQLLKYVTKNNFNVIKKQRPGLNRRTHKPFDPRVQVQVINQKLDDAARMFLYQSKSSLNMLAKIDEINGMIVDLMAA